MAIASGRAESRFASGAEWLARRLDWQRRAQELASQNEAESVTLQSVLADRGQQSKPEARGQKPYGVENVYRVSLNNTELGAKLPSHCLRLRHNSANDRGRQASPLSKADRGRDHRRKARELKARARETPNPKGAKEQIFTRKDISQHPTDSRVCRPNR
jgi:hypothetical protein